MEYISSCVLNLQKRRIVVIHRRSNVDTLRHLQLISGEQSLPVLLGYKTLDIISAHVYSIVEVSAPEHIVMAQQSPTLH